MKRSFASLLLLVLIAMLVGGVIGCASNEPDNASVRPWDSPQGWENGVPSSMYQPH